MTIAQLRRDYHLRVCAEIMYIDAQGVPKLADRDSRASVSIATELIRLLDCPTTQVPVPEQQIGAIFETYTRDFLRQAFGRLGHLRPGRWVFEAEAGASAREVTKQGKPSRKRVKISEFDQYRHIDNLARLLKQNPDLSAILGRDYLVIPDIVIGRYPEADEEINKTTPLVSADDEVSRFAPLRAVNNVPLKLLLHAIISCKWTLRSDRAQQIRFEGLNLIRLRRGHTPHIVAVAAEPLPSRLASLALGTGELDCVYHFAFPELKAAVTSVGSEDQLELLADMIEGRRLRDISDLPLDLAT